MQEINQYKRSIAEKELLISKLQDEDFRRATTQEIDLLRKKININEYRIVTLLSENDFYQGYLKDISSDTCDEELPRRNA